MLLVLYPAAVNGPKPQTHKERKAAGQALHSLLSFNVLHVRANDRDRDTYVRVVGTAWELHGEQGCCTCCWGGDKERGRRATHR